MGKWPRQGEEGPESVHPAPYLPIDHRNQSNRKMPTSPRSQTSRPRPLPSSILPPSSFNLLKFAPPPTPWQAVQQRRRRIHRAASDARKQLKDCSNDAPVGGSRSRLPPICIRHCPGYLSGLFLYIDRRRRTRTCYRTRRPVHSRVDLGGCSGHVYAGHVRSGPGCLVSMPAAVHSRTPFPRTPLRG